MKWLFFPSPSDPAISLPADLVWGFEWRSGRDVRYDIKTGSNILTTTGSPALTTGGLLDTNVLGSLDNSNHLFYNPVSTDDPKSNFKITHTIAVLLQARPILSTYEASFVISKDQVSSSQRDYLFYLESSGGTSMYGVVQNYAASGGTYTLNEWYLSLIEYDQTNNNYSLTINNSFVASGVNNFSSSNIDIPFFIGVRRVNNSNSFSPPSFSTFNHRLQYMYRWNRLLTLNEKSYLYNGGSFRFLS